MTLVKRLKVFFVHDSSLITLFGQRVTARVTPTVPIDTGHEYGTVRQIVCKGKTIPLEQIADIRFSMEEGLIWWPGIGSNLINNCGKTWVCQPGFAP